MVQMADIFREYGTAYLEKFGSRMLKTHKRAISDIIKCRTQAMGGELYQCPEHHQLAYKYHSCIHPVR